MENFNHRATYSPDDNKLRMYPDYRLDKEDYNKMRACGFKWAPRQELFVAPMWTPQREDLLLEWCGEIGDEDTSLTERAEERADRFEEYSEKRLQDANQAKEGVHSITEHIPLGQPILVGHHSEKHARRDAQRIENGMRKAVQMWETSKYWTDRAAGALHHAKYKELPRVRANRIKRIGADKRKSERSKVDSEKWLVLWNKESLTLELAIVIAGGDWDSSCYPLDKYPRTEHTYEGAIGVRGAMEYGIITHKEARNIRVRCHMISIAWDNRWIAHFENRLEYEKAMLGEQGGLDLIAKKARPKQLPLLNYRVPEGLSVESIYHRGEFSVYPQVEMTKDEYKKLYSDDKGTRIIENSHRVRITFRAKGEYGSRAVVFLTDSKVHEKPEPVEKKAEQRLTGDVFEPKKSSYQAPDRSEFDDIKDSLKAGVQTVVADQLFPTPPEIAERMVDYAEIEDNHRVLEPSAGTGNILKAIGNGPDKLAVERSQSLIKILMSCGVSGVDICQGDFLECNGDIGQFDRIVMNPPFKNGDDIKHINHALSFLKVGGKLVAICADGPRQNDQLKPLTDHWEKLPEGTFKNQGTMVNSALIIINK